MQWVPKVPAGGIFQQNFGLTKEDYKAPPGVKPPASAPYHKRQWGRMKRSNCKDLQMEKEKDKMTEEEKKLRKRAKKREKVFKMKEKKGECVVKDIVDGINATKGINPSQASQYERGDVVDNGGAPFCSQLGVKRFENGYGSDSD